MSTKTHTCNSCGNVYGPFDFIKVFTWKENGENKGLICETCLDARPLPEAPKKDMSTEARLARISGKNKKHIKSLLLGDLLAELPWIQFHASNEEKDEELFNTQYLDMLPLFESQIALFRSQGRDEKESFLKFPGL